MLEVGGKGLGGEDENNDEEGERGGHDDNGPRLHGGCGWWWAVTRAAMGLEGQREKEMEN